MRLPAFIRCLLSTRRLLAELKKEREEAVRWSSYWAQSKNTIMLLEQRRNADSDEINNMRAESKKRQQEHDLTFHQLHMLKASVEAHVNRARVQEALINEQAKHIEFLRDAYFDKKTDKPKSIEAFLE